jgi:LuxR family transcriptional regulator, maltose regulon positive regulatory protein
MVDPAARHPPAAGPVGTAGLLATKLHVPQTRRGFVARPRLADRLGQALGGELTLVCASAGFGKTALLADWARHSQRPVAWLSLDEADNDPARFWRHAAAALDRVRPGVAQHVAVLLGGLQPTSFEAVVAALVNELAGMTEEVVLVLDDYHLIQAPPVHQSVEFLVEHQPACLRLLLASRADPPLPLARLRARGLLSELREHDLRFTPQEATELLHAAAGPELPEAAVAALAERTEGWVAGLQLAALSLQGHADPAGFVAGFSGSHRYVLDYLSEEVLDGQPDEVRELLLETSVLERLSGPLCEAVTGRADSQQLLEQVERANLFLVPLDEERRWYRYHHLFAELLRARLRQQQPDRERELHGQAAYWYEAHGVVDDAIRHALGAGEPLWAARLVERHVEELLNGGERVTLDRWLSTLPEDVVRSRPRLLLSRAVSALIVGRLGEAEQIIGMADAARTDDRESHDPSVGREASLAANVAAAAALLRAEVALIRGDAGGERTAAAKAVARLTPEDRVLGTFPGYHFAMADWLDGRVQEAERGLAGVVADRLAVGETYLALWAAYDLAQVQRARGRLGAAMRTHRQALEMAAPTGRPAVPAAGMALAGMAEVELRRGHLADAFRHASESIGLCRQLAYSAPLAAGLTILAWIRQDRGDPAGALEAIAEAERIPNREVASLLNQAIAIRGRLLLAQGDLAGARRWVEERGVGEEDEPAYPREPEYLVLARVLLAQQEPDRALGLLERLHHLAAAQGRVGSVIEVQALQALALDALGDQAGVMGTLAEALVLAAPEGWLQVFVDEGAPMAALLARLVATEHPSPVAPDSGVSPNYLGRLLAAFERASGHRARPAGHAGAMVVAGLAEPLTERELEVLELLATGTSNRHIADELVVTVRPSRSTSATSSTSWARPTAPRPSLAPAS